MAKKVILLVSSYFGYATLQCLEKRSIFPDVAILSPKISRRKSFDEILSLSDKFNITELEAYNYSDAIPSLPTHDAIVTVDWQKDFFHKSCDHSAVYHVHPSLLPMYRGYGAVSEQFTRGVAVSGVSIYIENGKVDAGDIVFQERIKIEHDDIPATFLDKCAEHVADFIVRLSNGEELDRVEQDDKKAFYLTRNRSSGRLIDFNMSAHFVYNFIRAYMYPYSGAYFYYNGEKVYPQTVSIECWQGNYGESGEVVKVDDNGIEVACGDGTIIIQKFSQYLDLQRNDNIS